MFTTTLRRDSMIGIMFAQKFGVEAAQIPDLFALAGTAL
ncbi:MAG: hypothetical protein CM1200mP24_09000 [Gammaproteobacteria bacterium]|nr:MAG: hypothetical protein CM1200mP24_09000 [Gammaproteobacteria bacterium]